MFYSQFILAKKGPLGTIWIAAHLERKLRKNQVADTDIGVSVDSILFPEVPIALRLSSHLLLGVVRIYSKKVNYLFDDCSDALLKIKQAFRSAAVDLPPEQSKAPYHSITLPETFDLDDFELPDSEILQGNFVDHHVSAREHITLQDTMEGVSFPTSQFGPDERFGDGDASQIGLDIDEELFLDKAEAAGTSSTLMDIDGDPQPSAKASSPHEEDGNNGDMFSPLISSPANHAPSTPGLMEEPNLPSAQGVISDDHMDEDHNPLEFAAKELSGNASGQSELPNFGSVEFQVNEDLHHLNEQKTEMQTSPGIELSTEAVELVSSGNGQPDNSSEHVLAAGDLDNVANTLNASFDNEKPKGNNENDIDINGIAEPLAETSSVMNDDTIDLCASSDKAEPNGTCLLMSDGKSENNLSPVGIVDPISGAEPQSIDLNKLDAKTHEASNMDKSLSAPSMPVLQACNSDIHHTCNGVSDFVSASGLPTENDGHRSFATFEKEDVNTVSGVSVELEDNVNKDGNVDNMIAQENSLEKDHDSRIPDFPATEMLLSMPDLPVEQSSNFLVEFTPGPEGDGDATMDKMTSGRKRSYTESTLTIQSLNSAESSGATQSKRSVGNVPEDDDLLSSILVGRKSTGLKLMSTPPVTQPPPSKRQRAARSTAQKRKLLVDEATVLHGDTIRQQLMSTEDIRRVRKKAPGTRQEIWILQKQILEDEFFSEPVLTGMTRELVSLHHAALDLSRIRVIKDDHRNEQNETGTADGESMVENQGQPGSNLAIDGTSIELEMLAFENELTKEASRKHASDERAEKELGDANVPPDGTASGLDQAVSLGPIVEINGDTIIDSASPNKTGDVIEPGNIDDVQPTREDVSALEGVCGVDLREQSEVNANVCENVDFERSDEKPPLEESEVGTTVVREEDIQDRCSSPAANDISVTANNSAIPLEDGVCPTSDQLMEENQSNGVENVKTDEILGSEQKQDGNDPTPDYHNEEEIKLDSSYTAEADFSSRNDNIFTEGEAPEYFEADPKIFVEATPICTEYPDASGHADFGTDFMEHDTDFLNVDDDDVVEDYEDDDMPGAEENRVLDNSGWSSRTRAVANYLQVLFEKGDQQGKKDVSLENLLAGKTRKEASRMFFETLVLKTKDYIQVEQDAAFCDIKIKPRGKLLKSGM